MTAKIVKGGRLLEPTEFISEDNYDSWMSRGYPEINDVLLTTEAPLGEVALIKNKNVALGQRLITLQTKKNLCDSVFLKYYFQSREGQSALQSRASGSTVEGIKAAELKKIEVFLPNLPTQRAIASILTSLDDKIDLLHRQNKTLEQMAETLFRQWFEEKQNDDRISQLVYIQNGYAFKSKDFRETGVNGVIKIKNISGGIIDINNTNFIENEVAESIQERFRVNAGDILIAMTGAEIGKLGIIPKTKRYLWLNQRVGLLKEKHKGAKYLAYLQLKSDFGQDYIDNTATGSAQPNISGTGIENCGFPKLTEELIKEFSQQISELYEKVISNLGQIRTLTAMRDSLLPKLMSGEVKVKI